MIKHRWETEDVDGGTLGIGTFWICRRCGASGGPVSLGPRHPGKRAFYAGSGLLVSGEDCDEAKKAIEKYLRKKRKTKT